MYELRSVRKACPVLIPWARMEMSSVPLLGVGEPKRNEDGETERETERVRECESVRV
jgi:hypothetical protein